MLISIALAATTAVPAPNSAGGNELNTVIAAAANGDVLELASGTYCEGLVLADRVLTLRGQGDSATAIGTRPYVGQQHFHERQSARSRDELVRFQESFARKKGERKEGK